MPVPTLATAILQSSAIFGKWRPRLRALGNDLPFIDVVVTCYKESIDIIQDTVLAALNIDYPKDRFRVVVADDGSSPALKAWVGDIQGASDGEVHYVAREKIGAAGNKAGNLNHTLEFLEALAGETAEFLAGLDADMIPERDWLRAVVAHMNPEVGMICPAQVYAYHLNHLSPAS